MVFETYKTYTELLEKEKNILPAFFNVLVSGKIVGKVYVTKNENENENENEKPTEMLRLFSIAEQTYSSEDITKVGKLEPSNNLTQDAITYSDLGSGHYETYNDLTYKDTFVVFDNKQNFYIVYKILLEKKFKKIQCNLQKTMVGLVFRNIFGKPSDTNETGGKMKKRMKRRSRNRKGNKRRKSGRNRSLRQQKKHM